MNTKVEYTKIILECQLKPKVNGIVLRKTYKIKPAYCRFCFL